MSWCSDAPEDEVISLFAGLLANPDVPLSPQAFSLSRSRDHLARHVPPHENRTDCGYVTEKKMRRVFLWKWSENTSSRGGAG